MYICSAVVGISALLSSRRCLKSDRSVRCHRASLVCWSVQCKLHERSSQYDSNELSANIRDGDLNSGNGF